MPSSYKIQNVKYVITSNGAEINPKFTILALATVSDGIDTKTVPYVIAEDITEGLAPDATTLDNALDDLISTVNA